MDILFNFSETLKEFMTDNKLTNVKLKEATGCSVSNISRWLNRQAMPLLPSVIILSKYFGCSIDYFVGRANVLENKTSKMTSTVSKRIMELCLKNEITLYKLSKDLCMNDDLVYSWVHDIYVPNLYNLCKIADYFGCSIDYLVGYED